MIDTESKKNSQRTSARISDALNEELVRYQNKMWEDLGVRPSQGDLLEQAWKQFTGAQPKAISADDALVEAFRSFLHRKNKSQAEVAIEQAMRLVLKAERKSR